MVTNTINRLNLLTETRWLAIIPTKNIDKETNSDNIFFNLIDYEISPIELGAVDVNYLGYKVEFPSPFVRTQNKTFTFNYVMDSNMTQYLFLNKWINKTVVETGSGSNSNITNLNDIVAPIRVLILSEFKNVILEIIYENAWLQQLGAVKFTYQGNADIIKSSFNVKYERMTFNTDVTSWNS